MISVPSSHIILKLMVKLNKPIKKLKPIFISFAPITYITGLTSTKFICNSIPHSSTKTSPFFLFYGYEPHAYPPLGGKTFILALENCLPILKNAQKEAFAAHKSTCWIMTQQFPKKFSPWKVDNKVWLEATTVIFITIHSKNWGNPRASALLCCQK